MEISKVHSAFLQIVNDDQTPVTAGTVRVHVTLRRNHVGIAAVEKQ